MKKFNAEQAKQIVDSLHIDEIHNILVDIKSKSEQGETVLHIYKSRTNYISYESKDGTVYNIGDTLVINSPRDGNKFSHIQGYSALGGVTNIYEDVSGDITIIKKVWVTGSKNTGKQVSLKTSGITGLTSYIIKIELAKSSGEVKGTGMTSDEALAELKKCKDKLDLGLITQDEFNTKRAELAKLIK